MKCIELFAGAGGFRLGLEGAGDFETVYANEWDKHAASVYRYHWGEIDTRDITTVRASEIPSHDLITAGFPCQAFSVAGKRRGFQETRGTLFFDICRIARHHRTPYLLLENVKGLLNHDGGGTFETILRTLDELGYCVQWQVLNSKDYGVPQNRERIFIVANLRNKPRPQVFPLEKADRIDTQPDAIGKEILTGTQTARQYANWGGDFVIQQYGETRLSKDSPTIRTPTGGNRLPMVIGSTQDNATVMEDQSTALTEAMGQGGGHVPMLVKSATKKGYEEAQEGDSVNLSVPTSSTRRGRVGKGIAQTVDTGAQQAVVVGVDTKQPGAARFTEHSATLGANDFKEPKQVMISSHIRRLTPVECERLQGWPDNHTAKGEKDGKKSIISDTQRYKMAGNGVTANVVQAIAVRLV